MPDLVVMLKRSSERRARGGVSNAGVGEFYVVGYFGAYVFDGKNLKPLYKIESPCNSTGFPTRSSAETEDSTAASQPQRFYRAMQRE